MSIEQPLDPQLIEQTKQQIRSLVSEIAQLAKTSVAPEEFYGQFLPRVVSALAAVGGAVWTTNPEGQLALQYQINLQETNLRESEEHQAQHSRLLYKALSGSEAILVPPHSGPGDASAASGDSPAANPTEFLVLLGLLKTDLETIGLVEIFQRADASPSTQQGYLRFLVQMCELAGDFLKSHQLRHFSDRQSLWTQLEDFTRAIHASLDPREAAYTISNEGRRLIECDRVSVAIRKGKKCYIEAISGQDLFDKRSNTVRLLGKLATAVVASGDAVWYTGDTRDLPPQVEDAVQEYVDEAHSKTVAVVPLRRPPPPEEDDPKKRVEPEAPIGALIIEQIEDSRVTGSLTQRTEVVCKHSSTALANALEHQNLFLMPVWRALGKTRWIVEARTLPKTLSIAGAVLVLILILLLYPAKFTLESKGSLEPVLRQDVFAGIDGRVEDIPKGIDHGAIVTQGQLLLQLESTEAKIQLTEVQGNWLATNEQLQSVERELSDPRSLKIEERNRLAGQRAELKEKLNALERQWGYYKTKRQELDVKSPIDGEIVTWDLRNRLYLRPVQRGQVLMRVANPKGPWQLELHMPENRIGHIVKYAQSSKEPLDVTYILATEPGTTHVGKVKEIHRSAEIHNNEEGNSVLVKVDLDEAELKQLRAEQKLRPGATVTAKVYCGRRPLGYVLMHDLIEFLQARVFFRFL
jgi:multidrug efflux pump subunit AcrA (membrane-fusion protein)